MVAALSISPGSVIITEQPLFTIPRLTFDTLSTPSAKETVLLEFAKLPNDQQKAFLNLHNVQVKPVSELSEIESIIRTNGFGLGPDGIRSRVFDECSRFNHSCSPNAHFAWHEPTHTMYVHSTQDIAEGDEITISYVRSDSPHQMRQSELLSRYGFLCKSTACAATRQDLARSDSLRSEIQRLDEAISRGMIMTNPGRALRYCRELLHLRDVEGIEPQMPRSYHDAFQISVAHGDLARASAFMKLQVKWYEVYQAEASVVAEMRGFVERPE